MNIEIKIKMFTLNIYSKTSVYKRHFQKLSHDCVRQRTGLNNILRHVARQAPMVHRYEAKRYRVKELEKLKKFVWGFYCTVLRTIP